MEMTKSVIKVWLAATMLLIAVFPIEAQDHNRVHRIGFLTPRSIGPWENLDAFQRGLRELGYVERKNINIDYRYADGKYDRLPALLAELVSLKPSVIVTHTTPGALAAKNMPTPLPVVIAAAGDLVERQIVASHARPGGHITGFTLISRELDGKRLGLIKEAIPKLSRIAILVNPTNPAWERIPADLEPVSRALGLRVQRVEAVGPDEIEAIFLKLANSNTNAVLVENDTIFDTHRNLITELAKNRRVATIAERSEFAEAGGLLAYGVSLPSMSRRAAVYVDKILKGANVSELPIERPAKFDMVINLKTAKQIGLTIPPNVLVRADRVIR
jgi:putative tryptophan/tyrosine transport system substrate-binding protein